MEEKEAQIETVASVAAAEPSTTPAPEVDEGPKINCDVTLQVREGKLSSLKVKSLEDLTYSQVKEICMAGAQRVDVEFTNKCKKTGAIVYTPEE